MTPDPCRRVWKDVKDSLKRSKGSLFRVMLEYSLVYNSNYGPANTRVWFHKKSTEPENSCKSSVRASLLFWIACNWRVTKDSKQSPRTNFQGHGGCAVIAHKEELRQLRMKLGTWALAPKLITPASVFKNQLLVTLTSPSWSVFSQKAIKVKTPQQVADEMAHKALQNNWAEEAGKSFRSLCKL